MGLPGHGPGELDTVTPSDDAGGDAASLNEIVVIGTGPITLDSGASGTCRAPR
jgi:hypothetical protein